MVALKSQPAVILRLVCGVSTIGAKRDTLVPIKPSGRLRKLSLMTLLVHMVSFWKNYNIYFNLIPNYFFVLSMAVPTT